MNVNKTPVSILQEMMVKKGTSPSYELIHNGGGSHQNSFTYQVSCDGLSAMGTGRNKKDAKHEAATAMLEAIANRNSLPQLPASPCDTPVRTPLPMQVPVCPKSPANVPFRNAIGELYDLCVTNKLDEPLYEEISDVGPPHKRIFTAQCTVSHFVEEGIATTKKLAKHEAARKMLARINGLVHDDSSEIFNNENITREQNSSHMALVRYPELSVNNNESARSKVNWGLKVRDFHKKFKDTFDEENRNNFQEKLDSLSSLANKCQVDMNEDNLAQLKEEFESTLKSIEVPFQYVHYDCLIKDSTQILGVLLNTAPDIHEIGVGRSAIEAEVSALYNIITTMNFLMN